MWNILTWPAGENTADVVDRYIDKTSMITEMSSCPQMLCISGCWNSCIRWRIISTRWLPKCHHTHRYWEYGGWWNRCIQSKTSGYHLDLWTGWIRCKCDAHKKQVAVKQLYNRVPQTAWVSCSSRQWEPAPGRRLGPSGPPVEQPSRMRNKYCYSQRNLGSICCSLFRHQLTSHTQPFATLSRMKCERYIFLKKYVRSSLLLIMFPHIYVYV